MGKSRSRKRAAFFVDFFFNRSIFCFMKYYCPLCKSELVQMFGESVHPNDPKYGVTLYCPSWKCPAQEVSGHGSNVKDAWGVIEAKFMGKR